MAQRSEIRALYAAGVIQGVALVTFPAAGAVFTSPTDYGLSATEYGGMFAPQAMMAVVASLLGAGLRSRLGAKRVYLLGLAANLISMTLLVASRFVMAQHNPAYGLLLVATTCLGIGFGFTVPTLNTYAAAFSPQAAGKAVLTLNALLGLGTALAPVFVAVFVGLGCWWGLPVMVGVLLLGLLGFSAKLPLEEGRTAGTGPPGKTSLPPRFWIYAAFALLYGSCEAVNGSWAPLYMVKHFGASAALSSMALTVFWGTVTAGRMLFAGTEKWWPERTVCRVLPFVVVVAVLASAWAPARSPLLGLLTIALAGLGCSALLPLTISFAQNELTTIAASVAGGVVAFYQLGYGLAAFGAGPLQTRWGWSLNTIYGAAAGGALALAGLALVVTRRTAEPT